eukprot:5026182-Pyramimonas_sp.AAC.2
MNHCKFGPGSREVRDTVVLRGLSLVDLLDPTHGAMCYLLLVLGEIAERCFEEIPCEMVAKWKTSGEAAPILRKHARAQTARFTTTGAVYHRQGVPRGLGRPALDRRCVVGRPSARSTDGHAGRLVSRVGNVRGQNEDRALSSTLASTATSDFHGGPPSAPLSHSGRCASLYSRGLRRR